MSENPTSSNVSSRQKRGVETPPVIVFFDGVCVLCNRTVQFLLQQDRQQRLKFAPLQGETAAVVLKSQPAEQSVIVVRHAGQPTQEVLQRSDAILATFNELGGLWRVFAWLRIVPKFIRDGVYNLIARNRYKWFGRYDSCIRPGPDLRDRFLN